VEGARSESAPLAKIRPAYCKAPAHGWTPLPSHLIPPLAVPTVSKRTKEFSAASVISGTRFFWSVKRAEMTNLSIYFNLGLPPIGLVRLVNPLQSRSAIFLYATIGPILAWGSLPEIADTIIQLVSIDVIEYRRPRSVKKQPR
jgi:hypothetical protein